MATPDRGAPQVRQTLCRGSSTVAVHSRSCMTNICSTVHPDTRGSSYACTMRVSGPPFRECDLIWPSTPFRKNFSGPPPSHHTPQPPLPLALPGVMGMWPHGKKMVSKVRPKKALKGPLCAFWPQTPPGPDTCPRPLSQTLVLDPWPGCLPKAFLRPLCVPTKFARVHSTPCT